MNTSSKEHILQFLIKVGIILTSLALLGTPLITTAYFKSVYQLTGSSVITAVIVGIYISAIPYVWALVNLHTLSTMVIKGTPFTKKSEKSLKWISTCAFSEIFIVTGVVYYLKNNFAFFEHSLVIFPLFIFSFLSMVIGLLCLILSRLFTKARLLKEENDMTI